MASKESFRSYWEGLGVSEKMHRVGFIDKGVYLESHKGPHRCCIYWKKKDQIMQKCRELGHDGPRKGSWKMEV